VATIDQDTVGYTSCEVCRTGLGHAGDRVWLKFEAADVQEAAIEDALGFVQRCVHARAGGVPMMAAELRALALS